MQLSQFIYFVCYSPKLNISFALQIGNPLLKLDRDIPATYEYFWSHGMISDEIGLRITRECDFEDYTFSGTHDMSKSCNEAIEEANTVVGEYINAYDVILDVCYPSIVEQELRLRKYVIYFYYNSFHLLLLFVFQEFLE